MTTYNVTINDNKIFLFQQFLEQIGAKYEEIQDNFKLSEKQKQILIQQKNVPIEQCTDAEIVFQDLKNKYEL